MGRQQRRALARAGGKGSFAASFMTYAVTQMAERGAAILTKLHEDIGEPEHRSGHAVDALMNSAAAMEKAALTGNADDFERAAVEVLFLARDIAIAQGKFQTAPMAEA